MLDLTDPPNGTLTRHTTAKKRKPEKVGPITRTKKTAKRMPKADRVLYLSAAGAPWGLAILLLMVSMPHLASGFMTITGCGPLAGWALAVAIDASQVTAKLQLTLAKRYTTPPAARWTSAGIVISTTVMSASLNVLAFMSGATDTTGRVLAWAAGMLLPLLVLALSYTGSCFALAKVNKQPASVGKAKK